MKMQCELRSPPSSSASILNYLRQTHEHVSEVFASSSSSFIKFESLFDSKHDEEGKFKKCVR